MGGGILRGGYEEDEAVTCKRLNEVEVISFRKIVWGYDSELLKLGGELFGKTSLPNQFEGEKKNMI